MTGEELVEKVIDSAVKKLEKKIEDQWGEGARAGFKEDVLGELRKEGEHLKEILRVHTPDGFRLLDLMNRGGLVFTRVVTEKEHNYGNSASARDIFANYLQYHLPDEPRFGRARVTIIMEPVEEK